MSLRTVLRKLVGEDKKTTEVGLKNDTIRQFVSPWVRFYNRKAVWKDLQMMDHENVAVARGLDFVARFCTTFVEGESTQGFRLEASPTILKLLNPLAADLQSQSFEFVRYMLKFADLFAENVIDEDYNLVRVKLFPRSYEINKNVDEYGRLREGDPTVAMKTQKADYAAYDQTNDIGALVAAFEPYQISHFRFGHGQGMQYTEPHLGCAISLVKRLASIMDGLSTARLTRTYPREGHFIPVPLGSSEGEIARKVQQYKALMGTDTSVPYDTSTGEFRVAAKEMPGVVDTRLFFPLMYSHDGSKIVKGGVEMLIADSPHLENLEDVFLIIRQVVCAIGVPADFLNLSVGQRSFIDKTTPEKREAFLYLCLALQNEYLQVARLLLELQLILKGKNPFRADAQFQIIAPRINPREAEVAASIDLKRANTAIMWQQLGIPAELTGEVVLKMNAAQIATWAASGGTVAPNGKDPEKQTKEWVELARRQFDGSAESLMCLPAPATKEDKDLGIVTLHGG